MPAGQLRAERLYSAMVRRLTRARWAWLRRALIAAAIRRFGIDMREAALPDPDAYRDFNAFFTRRLRPDARPLPSDPRAVCAPAEGTVSALGEIRAGTLLQAKSRAFALSDLLGGDTGLARRLEPGRFITIYLSPRDYHRVHAPIAGRVRRMVHVPGRLFRVNQASVERVPDLFARNERVIFEIESARGPYALVMVGALGVSLIETAWSGPIPAGASVRAWRYAEAQAPELARGAELGCFNIGSSVILVLPAAHLAAWGGGLRAGSRVRVRAAIGEEAAARQTVTT